MAYTKNKSVQAQINAAVKAALAGKNVSPEGKKKSGSKWIKITTGKRNGAFMLSAWCKAPKQIGGVMLIKLFPVASGAKYGNQSKNGNYKYIGEVTFSNTGEVHEGVIGYWTGSQESKTKPSGGKMYLPQFNINMNPSTNWCGRISKR